MLVLVTTHLLFLRSTQAAPVEGPAQLDSTTKPWDVASEYRTLFEILYSCLTTLTYCTWTAWHPNIPRQTDGKITKILQRVKMMFSVLMAPEMMALWATLQFIGARKLAKTPEFKDETLSEAMGWGVSHGFFAQMGGFMLYSADGEPLNIIWPKDMVHMLNSVHIERPRLSKEEIDDRSKGDWIAKGLALIQTTYFLVQCVTRAAQRLPITELELITFAYTILNVYVYAMWWKKPQNVECAFPVYEKRLSAARRVLYERSAEAEEKSRSEESNQAAAYYANVNSNTPFYWRWLRRVAGFLLRLFVKPFFFAFQAWATPEEDKGIKATTMPPFYSYGADNLASVLRGYYSCTGPVTAMRCGCEFLREVVSKDILCVAQDLLDNIKSKVRNEIREEGTKTLEVELYLSWLEEFEFVLEGIEAVLNAKIPGTRRRVTGVGRLSFSLLFHLMEAFIDEVNAHQDGWSFRYPAGPVEPDPLIMTLAEECNDATSDTRSDTAIRSAERFFERYDKIMLAALKRYKSECNKKLMAPAIDRKEESLSRGCCLLSEQTGYGGTDDMGFNLLVETREAMMEWKSEGQSSSSP
ncbi:hypothetical protein H0H87_005122 [Tephrocybe sp. NHM501043]|nr:hypothetical protein H0H87_005122 [Tephrocybe sp. NHM501043]